MGKKISIITVVYNAGDLLEWTIKSIHDQCFKDIEHIIIDGGSNDRSLDIIKKYEHVITKWISEPDEGLYYAMNKGLRLAEGEYILFLNAGDIFYNTDVLENIFGGSKNDSDILYGQTMIVDPKGREIGMRRLKAPEVLTWKSLIDGMLVCHQSFIVKKSIAPEYNIKYKIAADYDWMLNCLKKAGTITNTHQIISKFLDGGLNKQNIRKALKERFLIMIQSYNIFLVVLNHIPITYRFAVSYLKNRRF